MSSALAVGASVDGGDGAKAVECEDLRALVARLEALQAQQRSAQQPNPELDALLVRELAGRPERRSRLAVLSSSALLRRKILACSEGGRGAGSTGLGLGSTHSWQERTAGFSDHNWPRATGRGERGARCPTEGLRLDPTLSRSQCFSVPRAKRFPEFAGAGEQGAPGPGEYGRSQPRGTAFPDGERVVLGANHTFPWKRALGRQINPVDVDATSLPSAPAYSFAMGRRALSDTTVGLGGPVKTDLGSLSPGNAFEQLASMRPAPGVPLGPKRRGKSTGGPRVRCIPMPPEEPDAEAGG